MKPIKTFDEFKKETKYPLIATLSQHDDLSSKIMRNEMKEWGAEKYMKGFNLALSVLSSLGEVELIKKIKEIAKL